MSIKTIIIICLISLFVYTFSGKLHSQPVDVAVILQDWLGDWEATYKVTSGEFPGTAKETMTIKGIDKNYYLQIHMEGDMTDVKAPGGKWVEDIFITYDLKEKGITGFYISSNGPDYTETIKGDMDGDNSMVLNGESRASKTVKTIKLKDDKLYFDVVWTDKKTNKTEPVFKRVFVKKK